jgi:D-threo-aldose 1-dehydrogenase
MLAGRYTLLEQTPLEKLFPVCEKRGISIVAAGPFNSGILATGVKPGARYFYSEAAPEILDKTGRIEKVCARHGVPLAAAALQFALGHPVVASVATGMVSSQEVEVNLRLMAHVIPQDFWLELKREGLLRQETPLPRTMSAA